MKQDLPIEEIKAELLSAWQSTGGAIISAPPGSGKTTQLPLWLLDATTAPIFLLIPKRLAVKLAAQQLAANFGEDIGQSIGYQLRNDQKISPKTRLIVTTYGSFLRILLNDSDRLTEATIIFDEFHERSVDQDLCYALMNQYLELFDESAKRIFMSATLNVDKIAQQTRLPIIESQGFSYPVDIRHEKVDLQNSALVANLIEKYWHQSDDHILVFCAGLAEIKQLERHLSAAIPVLILHGQLAQTPNLSALSKASATVILSTNIAESSVTLARVHTVIDLGLERYANTHPITGITELKTRHISKASATQRAGRAGRLAPGKCIRLWSADEHHAKVAHQPPEITFADLTDVVLNCLHWGASLEDLTWLDSPSRTRWQLAFDKLTTWQAIEHSGALTPHGLAMQTIGLQPWLSHLIALANQHQCLASAALLAAHLSNGQAIEYDPFQPQQLADFHPSLRSEYATIVNRFQAQTKATIAPIPAHVLVLALADRLIRWQTKNSGNLISGTEVQTHQTSGEAWGILLDGIRQGQRIKATHWLAVPETVVFEQLPVQTEVKFQPESNRAFVQIKRLGNIILSEQSYSPNDQERANAWLSYLNAKGEQAFQWSSDNLTLKERWLLASQLVPQWPAWPDSAAWATLAEPFLGGVKRFEAIELKPILEHALGYEFLNKLNSLLPTHWRTPTERQVAIQYDAGHKKATISLKLQEVFGLSTHPKLAGSLPLTLDLTAPNGRPVASVTDLPHFWQQVYPEVRKELRGRYAKHPWPEDPIAFAATAKTNRQLRLDGTT